MPYGGRHPYEIASMLCCIEAREALLRGLFVSRKPPVRPGVQLPYRYESSKE